MEKNPPPAEEKPPPSPSSTSTLDDLWKQSLNDFTKSFPKNQVEKMEVLPSNCASTAADAASSADPANGLLNINNSDLNAFSHESKTIETITMSVQSNLTISSAMPKTGDQSKPVQVSSAPTDDSKQPIGSSENNSNASGPHSNTNRIIRSYTLFDNRDFLPRTFQIELYEACKYRDTIVFLRPGNGKHFITVMLVKYFAPKVSSNLATSSLPNDKIDSSAQFPPENRKVFFLTKSCNSIRLYGSVFRAHTSFRVAEYLDFPDDSDEAATKRLPWQRKDEWMTQFNSNDIHLMLDSMFERLQNAGFVSAEHIQLLILDEVHRIILKSDEPLDCYTRIVRNLRADGLVRGSPHYRILGLSASILLEDVSSRVFELMIGKIERQLDCTCETYADLRMINKYSIQCRIRLRYYPPLRMDRYDQATPFAIDRERLRLSIFMIRNYAAGHYDFLVNLADQKLTEQHHLVTHQMMSCAINDVLYAYGTLGEWCTIKLIDLFNREIVDTITLLNSSNSTYVKLLDSTLTTLLLVRRAILAYLPTEIAAKLEQNDDGTVCGDKSLTLFEFFSLSSPKLHLLAQLLSDYLDQLRSGATSIPSTFAFPANICGIIYAHRRSTVRIVARWLTELVTLTTAIASSHSFTFLLPDYVFLRDEDRASSNSNLFGRKSQYQQKSLHEIFYYRRQEEVLKRFRFAHNCNLLVTSSMSAEGLDVNRCNFVCCFDGPKTFQQYIQSKGRVRTENGLYVVMTENDQHEEHTYVKSKFRQFVEIETIFTKLVPLANDISIESSTSARDNFKPFDAKKLDQLFASTTAAAVDHLTGSMAKTEILQSKAKNFGPAAPYPTVQLTAENAISILNRYCLKLPSDTFTKLAPHYYIDTVSIPSDGFGGAPKYQCRLYLPINSTFRDEIRGDPMSNRMLAKRSAAFKAVKTLQELGELDGNFYPIGKETNRYIEKLGLQECFIATNKIANNGIDAAAVGTMTTTSTTQQPAQPQQQQPQQQQQPSHHRGGNRFNRLQARNIASKRRQYYSKKVANVLSSGDCFVPLPVVDEDLAKFRIANLYEFDMRLSCPLPDEQNTRGRPVIDPSQSLRSFAIIVPNSLPPICDFTIYNRSGEVTITLRPIELDDCARIISGEQRRRLETFHSFTIENVLRMNKSSLRPAFDANASNGNVVIVPVNRGEDTANNRAAIDWPFIETIIDYQTTMSNAKSERPVAGSSSAANEDEQNGKKFVFQPERYRDAVIMPTYRRDKTQAFFYVAEICADLTPLSAFPDHGFATFEEYYRKKYGLTIGDLAQPLLDVDHTSTRLNLLTPRYLNRHRNGDDFSLITARKQANNVKSALKKSSNLQQKQILIPELCILHPFPASLWRKAVCLPCMLYRLNSLLVAEELRLQIAREANIGLIDLPAGVRWPSLDFGWSKIVKETAERIAERKKRNEQAGEKERAEASEKNRKFSENNIRKNVSYNHGGRPAESAVLPAKPRGFIKLDSFAVDTFDSAESFLHQKDPPPMLVDFESNIEQQQQQQDTLTSIGHWEPFAETIQIDPELPCESLTTNTNIAPIIQPDSSPAPIMQLDHIEIISSPFGDTGCDLLITDIVSNEDEPNLSDIDDAIYEVDDDGNRIDANKKKSVEQIEPQIRIGSPTQFDTQSDEDEDAMMFADCDDYLADRGQLFPLQIDDYTDWTSDLNVDEDDKSLSSSAAYVLDIERFSKDISNMDQIVEDEMIIKEMSNYFGGDKSDKDDDDDDDGHDIDAATKRGKKRVKEVSDDVPANDPDNASYSDFDVDDDDDFDEDFDEVDDVEVVDDDDEDGELDDLLDDDEEDDDEFRSIKSNRRKKMKKTNAPKKTGKSLKVGRGGGSGSVADASAADSAKTKTLIYDILRYELLYDYRQFEPLQDVRKQRLYGTDGSGLLQLDRVIRSRNKRIYDRIHHDEQLQVWQCVNSISDEFDVPELFVGPYSEMLIDQEPDRFDDSFTFRPDERLFDVVFARLSQYDIEERHEYHPRDEDVAAAAAAAEDEDLNEEERKRDPRELMADYGLSANDIDAATTATEATAANMTDEVKFGELLPNRSERRRAAEHDDDDKLTSFSFDRNPTTEGVGICLGPDPSLVLQAITMSNSSDGINLERLETVGDSFLKYSITAFLFCMCPDLNEGKLSFLRSRQISNINLHRLGQRINLGQLMIASKFEPNDNWCPPGYKVIEDGGEQDRNKVPYNLLTQHSIPNKSIADCVEALIGTYLISSGSQGAIQFMDWLGLKVLPREFRTLTKVVDTVSGFSANTRERWLPTPKSPLITPKDSPPIIPPDVVRVADNNNIVAKLDEIYRKHRLDRFEDALGYRFRDKAYLVQAFTHNSYYENTVTDCYQRLEFLGDAVLDYLITRYLYEDPRCHSPGTLTDLRSALVNNTFFASLAVKYNFHKYLMMLSFELFRVVDGFVRKFNICNQDRLNDQQQQQVESQDAEQRSCVYWELFISENEAEHLEDIEVPKALGDIFESVAGAIYLDSGMSLDAVWAAYYPMMKPEIEYFSFNVPKSPIRVLLEKQPQNAKFGKPEITSGRKIRVCVEVFNVGKFVGVGRNKRIAKCTAAKRALRALKVIEDAQQKRFARFDEGDATEDDSSRHFPEAPEPPEMDLDSLGFKYIGMDDRKHDQTEASRRSNSDKDNIPQ